MENRKYTRFVVRDDTFAELKAQRVWKGRICDISPDGLGFCYVADEVPAAESGRVDIYLGGNGFHLKDVPCTIAHVSLDGSSGTNGDTCYRCGLRFGEMSGDHRNKLNFLLSNYTTGVEKTRGLKILALQKLKSARRYLVPLFIDFLLLTTALLGAHLAKRESLRLPVLYLELFAVFYGAWAVIALIMEKYRKIFQKGFIEAVKVIVKSNIALVYLISFAVVLSEKLSGVSRLQTFGVCAAFLFLEAGAYGVYALVYQIRMNGNGKPRETAKKPGHKAVSYPLLLIDAGLLAAAFVAMNYVKRGGVDLPPKYDQALLMMYALWAFGAVFANKFNIANFKASYMGAFSHCLKATVLMGAGLGTVIFALRLFYYSRLQLFGVPLVLLALEGVVFYLYWLYQKQGKIGKDIETREAVKEAVDVHENNRRLPEEACAAEVSEAVETKLRHALEFFDPRLFEFIKGTVDLRAIERCQTALMSTDDINAIEPLEDSGNRLIINLHKTNDVRWFNRYFLQVYRKLKNHGYFIGNVNTITTHKKYYDEKYPRGVAGLFYVMNYIWGDVFPKLPVTKKLYFTLTRGRNRRVSKAEIFGRLYFCGFQVVDDMEIGNRLFFIARKVKIPAYQTNPTYGPIVQLKRIGYQGRMIHVYKFRTMYPYSEFLQEYVYRNNHLDAGGKFKDDFRVTEWGKFMRATWLDELPMIINWFKGDLKLFGVRPLSRQYLGLYTDELRRLRTRVLPGLIPPFYADMPKTLAEIVESEYRYIQAYLKAPVRTQLRYLWLSSVNILFKGARSN